MSRRTDTLQVPTPYFLNFINDRDIIDRNRTQNMDYNLIIKLYEKVLYFIDETELDNFNEHDPNHQFYMSKMDEVHEDSLEDNSTLNRLICGYIMEELETYYNKPTEDEGPRFFKNRWLTLIHYIRTHDPLSPVPTNQLTGFLNINHKIKQRCLDKIQNYLNGINSFETNHEKYVYLSHIIQTDIQNTTSEIKEKFLYHLLIEIIQYYTSGGDIYFEERINKLWNFSVTQPPTGSRLTQICA